MTRKIFAAGSLAKMYVEVAEWLGNHTDEIQAKDILVPFTGFNRMASGMCRADTVIDTCDYQRLAAAIIHGVYATSQFATNVDKPRFHRGLAVDGKLMTNPRSQPDLHSAGFIDWVCEYGTWLDKACIGMSIPGQTMHGWMSTWTGNFDSLWTKFLKVRDQCAEYIPMPGEWRHFEDDFFALLGTGYNVMGDQKLRSHYDVLAIDPPRLSGPTGKDSYSTGAWVRLNTVMGGTAKIRPWNEKNYFYSLKRVLDISSDYTLFTWQEGWPRTDDIKVLLLTYGILEDQQTWESYNKTIYGWRIRRR